MRTLPPFAALTLAIGVLACAGAPATALEGAARTTPTALEDGLGAAACPDTGSREQVLADHVAPAEPVVEGAAVVVVLDTDPAPAAALPVVCGTLSGAQVPGIPEGGVDAGLGGPGRSGNLGALVVAGAGALSVVGSAVVAQRRTAARQ